MFSFFRRGAGQKSNKKPSNIDADSAKSTKQQQIVPVPIDIHLIRNSRVQCLPLEKYEIAFASKGVASSSTGTADRGKVMGNTDSAIERTTSTESIESTRKLNTCGDTSSCSGSDSKRAETTPPTRTDLSAWSESKASRKDSKEDENICKNKRVLKQDIRSETPADAIAAPPPSVAPNQYSANPLNLNRVMADPISKDESSCLKSYIALGTKNDPTRPDSIQFIDDEFQEKLLKFETDENNDVSTKRSGVANENNSNVSASKECREPDDVAMKKNNEQGDLSTAAAVNNGTMANFHRNHNNNNESAAKQRQYSAVGTVPSYAYMTDAAAAAAAASNSPRTLREKFFSPNNQRFENHHLNSNRTFNSDGNTSGEQTQNTDYHRFEPPKDIAPAGVKQPITFKENPTSVAKEHHPVDTRSEHRSFYNSFGHASDELPLKKKKTFIQIPDITITESSDSENENESESEDDILEYSSPPASTSYDRIYPSVLYDITEVEEPFSDASDLEFESIATDDGRNIVRQESKFQDQIKTLKCEVETKDTENMQLRGKINDLQRDITTKTWRMDRLHAELESFQTEADCVRKKLHKVEEDLNKYKAENAELNEELIKKLEYENEFKKVAALQNEVDVLRSKISELETELKLVKTDKEDLYVKLQEVQIEEKEKISTLEIALDDTLKQKQKLQIYFEEEYEKLRTVHIDREQQLVNDFEWKLREVELMCKKKLDEKEVQNEEKIKQIKKQLQNEMQNLKTEMKQIEKLKTYEAEASQLRGLTQEQQLSLRIATRTAEQLQTNERLLNEEIERLRTSLEKERSHLATVQNIHSREIAEKDRKHSFKLEQQKNELNSEWEDKFRREAIRLKLDLEKSHREETRHLIEEAKSRAENQLQENSQIWEKKLRENKKDRESLEKEFAIKEESYRKELLRLQTNSDRDMLELRRKLDKLDLSYQEKMEKKQEKHELEMETLRESSEKKIQQNEQICSQQVSSARATLELVKEQLQREAEEQVAELNKKYILQTEQQYDRLISEKEEAIARIEKKYSIEMCELQNRFREKLEAHECKETELLRVIEELKETMSRKSEAENELQEKIDSLHSTISELQEKIAAYEVLSKETKSLLKKRETEHVQAMSQVKAQYENEIKSWQSKSVPNQKESSQKEKPLPDSNSKPEEPNTTSGSNPINSNSESRSSRRKARGRHRNSRKCGQHPQLNHQFSTSSL